VAYQFDHKGVINVKASGEDALLMVLDAGAEDAVEQNGEMRVITAHSDLAKVRDGIKAAGLEVTDAELSYEPNTTVEIDAEKQEKAVAMLEAFEDLDDVVNTYTNLG